jgi:hypothetical protein
MQRNGNNQRIIVKSNVRKRIIGHEIRQNFPCSDIPFVFKLMNRVEDHRFVTKDGPRLRKIRLFLQTIFAQMVLRRTAGKGCAANGTDAAGNKMDVFSAIPTKNLILHGRDDFSASQTLRRKNYLA